jgi:hypothetical protein
MTFTAQSNYIGVDNGSTNIFNTGLRMPHILYSISGTYSTQPAPISIAFDYSPGINAYTMLSTVNTYVATSDDFTFANAFVWGYIKPTANAERTEIDTGNPIFISGTICTRIYIEESSYRGALLITPRAYDGYIGFQEEHTYRANRGTNPRELYISATSPYYVNPSIQFTYTLYYGRFI